MLVSGIHHFYVEIVQNVNFLTERNVKMQIYKASRSEFNNLTTSKIARSMCVFIQMTPKIYISQNEMTPKKDRPNNEAPK